MELLYQVTLVSHLFWKIGFFLLLKKIIKNILPAFIKWYTIFSIYIASYLFKYEVPEAEISSTPYKLKKKYGLFLFGQGKSTI